MIYSHYLVRPYYKTLGIWYWCTRTLYANVKVAEDYYISPNWYRIFDSYVNNGTLDSKLEGDIGRCTEFCVNELIAVNLLDQTARSLQTSSKAV